MDIQVSVVIPYFNSEATIERAIKSVLNQTFNFYEIILINDGSTDSSEKVVEGMISSFKGRPIRNISQENSGPSKARNSGIRAAKGKYIAFLDADDEWLPEKLERQIKIMNEADADMIGCNINLVKNNGSVVKKYFVREPFRKIEFKKVLFKHYFITPTVVVKRDVILAEGLFPEGQGLAEDSYIFTRITRKYNAYLTNEFLVNVHKRLFGESGLSARMEEMEKWELTNFYKLFSENKTSSNKMGVVTYILASTFSILKYFRRKLLAVLKV